MHIDGWTLALQAINVLILVWLLGRFLFHPVMDAIAARQAQADALLAEAQASKTTAAALETDLKARADGFAVEAGQQRAELHAALEAERTRLLAEARSDADALTKQASAATAAERVRMAAALEEKAATLAGEMAGRLLARLPAAQITSALFDSLLDRIAALPEDERDKLARDAPLAVATSEELSDATREECLRRLKALLPGLEAPSFAVDPTLIAGFELRGPHVQVRNSWRADLDAILTRLKEDDHARLG